MSKQYLTIHTVDDAHPTTIFSIAATKTSLISASGSATLRVHSTTDPTFPLQQEIQNAHRLGCHHVCTARGGPGNVAASVGFEGDVKIWRCANNTSNSNTEWALWWAIPPTKAGSGEPWAVALSADENYLACTTHDGCIHVWDISSRERIQTYETGSNTGDGSFAMAVDLSQDGKFTASGHESGAVFVFNNDAGRMAYSLSGLASPIRAVAFSPGCTLLAATGNAGLIAIYDIERGEHVANLSVPGSSPAWISSLDWSETGEYLLSGALNGKVKVWDVTRGACVATHSETEHAIWSVRWLPKQEGAVNSGMGKGERFCAAGASNSLCFYREATGT